MCLLLFLCVLFSSTVIIPPCLHHIIFFILCYIPNIFICILLYSTEKFNKSHIKRIPKDKNTNRLSFHSQMLYEYNTERHTHTHKTNTHTNSDVIVRQIETNLKNFHTIRQIFMYNICWRFFFFFIHISFNFLK